MAAFAEEATEQKPITEEEKRKQRAQRFGTSATEPGKASPTKEDSQEEKKTKRTEMFGSAEGKESSDASKGAVDNSEEYAKCVKRAQRFGLEIPEPMKKTTKEDKTESAWSQRAKPGKATETKEDEEKRMLRAKRFGIPVQTKTETAAAAATSQEADKGELDANAAAEYEKCVKRAKRFGLDIPEAPRPTKQAKITETDAAKPKEDIANFESKLSQRSKRFGTRNMAAADGEAKNSKVHGSSLSTEELEKRRLRAQRFGVPMASSDAEAEKKRARLEKFANKQ